MLLPVFVCLRALPGLCLRFAASAASVCRICRKCVHRLLHARDADAAGLQWECAVIAANVSLN